MCITAGVPQLGTTRLPGSVAPRIARLGMTLASRREDLCAGIQASPLLSRLKRIDHPNALAPFVRNGGHFHLHFNIDNADGAVNWMRRNGMPLLNDVHSTCWQIREFLVPDDQGHVPYPGGPRP